MNYSLEPQLSRHEFIDLLERSKLAERRPVAEPQKMEAMLRNADVICTARSATGTLIGVARAITDFAYCTYLSDLAVDLEFQRQGIGRRLIRETHEAAGLGTTLILLAAPAARDYYARVGFDRHNSCWIRKV
ncbi:MAG: GNAT family N-acetyltransferase [Planctomycetota bacterium]